jgi:hypothetical protein
VKNLLKPVVRKWAYGVATGGLVVLGAYGIVDGQEAAAWSVLAAAVTGMAFLNTDADAG